MGIPYSRQINAAFSQVTPLVASAYEVLQTTKNISLLLAAIQILTVLLLALILLALLAIAYAVNPDLEAERRALVTPTLRWLAGRVERGVRSRLWWVLGALGCLAVAGFWWVRGVTRPDEGDGDAEGEEEVLPPVESPVVGAGEGKDVQGLKRGRSTQ